MRVESLPRCEKLGDVTSDRVGHLPTPNVGHAVKGQVDVDWVTGDQVVFDGLDDQLHEVTACPHQDRDEQIALEEGKRNGENITRLKGKNAQRSSLYYSSKLEEVMCMWIQKVSQLEKISLYLSKII